MTQPVGVFHRHFDAAFCGAECRRKSSPPTRQARIDRQAPIHDPQTKDGFDAELPGPAGRTCVPGPATKPEILSRAVNIAGQHIGLALIMECAAVALGAADRVDDIKHLPGSIAIAEPRQGMPEPCGRMGILPTVFADSRRIGPNIARVARGDMERRIKQLYQPCVLMHQP